ncbi:type IV toxin-antitoxin system AbiEi family antitoxin domain-containing protein [Vibrio crassostreae]|uniref:type IV toxin-antitoxin system AbiEi family antitoxin domain-containing protein n=1 Tax=Vibrio crassostreae TaxID=246167 RepID=UPI001B31248C|nr:hypothetical protein [Vibrio crassostreae]
MNKTISLNEALKRTLIELHEKPTVSRYELISYIYKLYRDREFQGLSIGKISLQEPDYRVVNRNIDELEHKKIISQHLGLPIYFITSRKKPTAQQYLCSINPFCYLSYLSAMEWHGVTDRMPHTVDATTCMPAHYRELVFKQIQKDFPGVNSSHQLTVPRVTKIPSFDNKKFQLHQSRTYKQPKEIVDTGGVRVASLGDTFLDMLKKPNLCGGVEHVFDVFEEYAEENLALIVRTIDKKGSGMDKARAGYILEEICNLSHRTIEQWKSTVQRGGSRKLVPENPYKDVYSETWCISINV